MVGSPNARRVRASKFLGDYAQHRVIVARLLVRDGPPVHRFRRNKQIADKLSIGETTVKNNVSNVHSKLGANDWALTVDRALRKLSIRKHAEGFDYGPLMPSSTDEDTPTTLRWRALILPLILTVETKV